MKIGTLKVGKTKSLLVNSFFNFTKCLSENVDERLGYSFYRGVIYSYNDDIHIALLGADIGGRFRVIQIAYDGTKFIQKVKGLINEDKICRSIDELLSVIEKMPTPISKIYFDFNEKVDPTYSNCYMYEDLEEVGSNVILIETDKTMVDMYMLKSASGMCSGTLLCESYKEVYMRLSAFKNMPDEIEWFKRRGVKVG